MKNEKQKNKQAKASYTYLTSKNIKSFINTFQYETAEQEILNDLTKLFHNFGKIVEYESILTSSNEIKLNFIKHFPEMKDVSEFAMKSQLKKHFKKCHLARPDISQFWSHFVFGFNAISRKLERGIPFDVVLIDKSLADAPILGHLRQLATVHANADIRMALFANDKLVEAVNSDSKKFGKLLMVGLVRADPPAHRDVLEFRQSLLGKIGPLFEVERVCMDEEASAVVIEVPQSTGPTEKKTKITATTRSPYVIDVGEVNLLIVTRLQHPPSSRRPIDNRDEGDYLSDLKRVRVDTPLATTFIRPPDQQKKKKKVKKAKNKAAVK